MGVTLITMGAGNVIVLEETLKSFYNSGVCNEVIYGDLLLFPEDRSIVHTYRDKYNLKVVELPFNYIFNHGFSSVLNELAQYATNDLVVYMNTSEVIEKNNGITELLSDEYNCYFFDHATDPHRWYRFYNRHELRWSGCIHESLEPISPQHDFRPYHKPIFRMKDLEKDMYSTFKAKVFNDVKEIVYFKNYMRLVDNPNDLGGTDAGWLRYAKTQYDSYIERLNAKGIRYKSFIDGNLYTYLKDVYSNPEFEKERFDSNIGIEYQGDKKFLL